MAKKYCLQSLVADNTNNNSPKKNPEKHQLKDWEGYANSANWQGYCPLRRILYILSNALNWTSDLLATSLITAFDKLGKLLSALKMDLGEKPSRLSCIIERNSRKYLYVMH